MTPHNPSRATTDAPASARDYTPVHRAADEIAPGASREERMRAVVEALWAEFGADQPADGSRAVSWVGFYERVAGEDREGHEMVLGPSRNKPACSPIGLHGACGQSFARRETLIVTDVAHLGEGYVACDPRDRSELVIPTVDPDGTVWGVIDFDSWDIDAFDDRDADEVERVLRTAGLLSGEIARRSV